MTDSDADYATAIHRLNSAIAGPDEKLSPGEVPVMELLGVLKMPATEGHTMLAFSDGEDNTVGVRLDDDELEKLKNNLGGF
jgi:hypothetical protein